MYRAILANVVLNFILGMFSFFFSVLFHVKQKYKVHLKEFEFIGNLCHLDHMVVFGYPPPSLSRYNDI